MKFLVLTLFIMTIALLHASDVVSNARFEERSIQLFPVDVITNLSPGQDYKIVALENKIRKTVANNPSAVIIITSSHRQSEGKIVFRFAVSAKSCTSVHNVWRSDQITLINAVNTVKVECSFKTTNADQWNLY